MHKNCFDNHVRYVISTVASHLRHFGPCICVCARLEHKLSFPRPPASSHLPHIGPAHALHASAAAAGLPPGQLDEYLARSHVLPIAPDMTTWEDYGHHIIITWQGLHDKRLHTYT